MGAITMRALRCIGSPLITCMRRGLSFTVFCNAATINCARLFHFRYAQGSEFSSETLSSLPLLAMLALPPTSHGEKPGYHCESTASMLL